MKKNLLYSLLTSGTLLLGGLAGYAVSTDLPLLTQNTRAEQSYTVTPENGGTSEKASVESFTTKIKFDFGGDVVATATNPDAKITVSYNDVALTRYNRATEVMYWDDEDIGEIGFVAVPHAITGNLEICLNPRMFNTPGVLKIHIDEGCFSVNGIGTPEVDYTHTFGEAVPVEAAIVLKAVSPEESKEVKSLKSAVLYLDVNRMGEAFAMFDESKLSNVTIAKDGGEPSAVTSVAFDEESYLEGAMGYKVTFPELTEAGVYTLTVGAGCFYLGTDTTLPRPADAVGNDVITAKFTVNPDAKLPIEKYVVMSPEQSPVKIKSISSVVIDFPEVSMLGIDDTAVATLTNTVSKKAYKGELGRNWSLGGMHTAEVFFYDGETPVESVSEAGTYELEIAAGAFADGEELSKVIKATFEVDPALVKEYSWTATPQNLSKIAIPEGKALQIEFAIEDAETVEYEEWENPNHDPQYGTKVKSVVVTYNGESVPQVKNAWASENAKGWSLKDNWGDPYIIIGVNSEIFSRPGILQVSIDQGMYTVDEENPSPAINYSITVGDLSDKEYEVKVSPKMDLDTRYLLEDFKEFTIEFLNAEKAEPKTFEDIDDNNNPVIRYDVNPHLTIGQKLRYFGDYTIEKVADAAHPTFKLKFTDLMSEAMQEAASLGGWLELSIDKDSFILDDGQPSPDISQTWTLKRTKEIDNSWEASPTGDIVNEGYGLYANFKFNDDETLSLRS
ncbi:MAG: hypothetical protein K2O56_05725, partial [Muribaculaceae bacterium]|nr:hypothetical protein [Muribaculaceae bacterium]